MSKELKGAGGTSGGVGRFFIGLTMLIVGGYMFLNAVQVSNHFSLGRSLYGYRGMNLTGGMVLVPFVFGIGMIFYNSKNIIGWVLTLGSLAALSFGIITSINMRLRPMTGFDLITILVLAVGGLGMFLSSLKDFENTYSDGSDNKISNKTGNEPGNK